MDVICTRCGASVPAASAFCSNCGRPMQVAGASRAVPPAFEPHQARRWYRRPLVIVFLSFVALIVTGVAGGAWYLTSRLDALGQLGTPPPQIDGARLGGSKGTTIDTGTAREQIDVAQRENEDRPSSGHASTTILVMGVDARPGEAIDVDVRPDSLAVVYLDGESHSCRMLSIPRDTRVELPGYGQSKINHALAVGGVPYEQLVVENLLGIDIDHYGLIDFAGMATLVDAIGGVTIVNTEEFYEHPFTYPVGTLELNGEEALNFARYRGGPDGDFGRQERQQTVVRAILTQSIGLDAVVAIPELLGSVEGHVRTDLGVSDLVRIGQEFRSGCTAETLEGAHLDGTVMNAWDDLLQMELSFVIVDDAEIRSKVAWLQGNG